MNSENSKISEAHKLLLDLSDKIDLKRREKYVALSDLNMKKIKKLTKKNKLEISAATRNVKFELPDESYFVLDIQDYSVYIVKKHETLTDNPPARIYVNKIENKITFTF